MVCDKLVVLDCVLGREAGSRARIRRVETIDEVVHEIEKVSPSSTVILVLVVMVIGGSTGEQ